MGAIVWHARACYVSRDLICVLFERSVGSEPRPRDGDHAPGQARAHVRPRRPPPPQPPRHNSAELNRTEWKRAAGRATPPSQPAGSVALLE